MPTTFTSARVKGTLTVVGSAVLGAVTATSLILTSLTTGTLVVTTSFTGSGTFRDGQLNSGTGVFLNDLLVTRNLEAVTLSGSTSVTNSKAGKVGSAAIGRPQCTMTGGTQGYCPFTSTVNYCACTANP